MIKRGKSSSGRMSIVVRTLSSVRGGLEEADSRHCSSRRESAHSFFSWFQLPERASLFERTHVRCYRLKSFATFDFTAVSIIRLRPVPMESGFVGGVVEHIGQFTSLPADFAP